MSVPQENQGHGHEANIEFLLIEADVPKAPTWLILQRFAAHDTAWTVPRYH